MNSNEKFEKIYSKLVENNLSNLEKARANANREKIINTIISIICVIAIVALFFSFCLIFYTKNLIIALVVSLSVSIAFIVHTKFKPQYSNHKTYQYNDKFKSEVITALLNSFNETIEYFPYRGIKPTIYDEAEFENYDRFSSEDLVYGKLKNNCNFLISEVLTEYEIQDSNGNRHYNPIFCGIFSKVKTPKPFNASLYLRKDRKDKNLFDRAFRTKLPFDNLRVETDSQEFEKVFDVYCTDKIIAMQLLTADIMQLLIDFQEEMNMDYELTIKNNCIYVRFMSGKMFETSKLTKSSLDKETLYKYYKMLDFIFSLTDKLINLIKNTEY